MIACFGKAATIGPNWSQGIDCVKSVWTSNENFKWKLRMSTSETDQNRTKQLFRFVRLTFNADQHHLEQIQIRGWSVCSAQQQQKLSPWWVKFRNQTTSSGQQRESLRSCHQWVLAIRKFRIRMISQLNWQIKIQKKKKENRSIF